MGWERPGSQRGFAAQDCGRQTLMCPQLIRKFQWMKGQGHEFDGNVSKIA